MRLKLGFIQEEVLCNGNDAIGVVYSFRAILLSTSHADGGLAPK